MTAVPLFDRIVETTDSGCDNGKLKDQNRRLMSVARSMVALVNRQFKEIRELDENLGSGCSANELLDMDSTRAIRRMYAEAADDAERILKRIDTLERNCGHAVPDSDELRDWHDKTMAMLSIPLESIAGALEQSLRGEVVSAAEMRHELHSRLHP